MLFFPPSKSSGFLKKTQQNPKQKNPEGRSHPSVMPFFSFPLLENPVKEEWIICFKDALD